MKYKQILALCKKFNVKIELNKGLYKRISGDIPDYLLGPVETYLEKLYMDLKDEKDNISDKKPVLLWSNLLNDYFTFFEDKNNNITKIAFLSGINYTKNELAILRSLDSEGKKFYHKIKTEFR